MKKIYYILSALFLCVVATSAQEAGKTVVIKTNVGTMKAILYDDVPNHTRTFIERAKRGFQRDLIHPCPAGVYDPRRSPGFQERSRRC